MPEGGDGAACPAALPDEGRWMPWPVALARQWAQETVRHAPASPSVGVAEAPTPKLDAVSPQRNGGEDSAVAEPLKGKGGAVGREDAGGARALPLIQLRAPCAVGTSVGPTREKGGASGRTMATHRPYLAPQGVYNLGEALAAIFSLASFPPMLGFLHTSFGKHVFRSCLATCSAIPRRSGVFPPLIRETRVVAVPGSGAANTVTRRVVMGLAMGSLPNLPPRRPSQQCLLWPGGRPP
jgi:hypothetical protein